MRKQSMYLLAAMAFCAALTTSAPGWAQQAAAANDDKRSPVVLRPNEKAAMLGDMREYLKGMQEMFAALAKDDMDTVASTAKAMGTIKIFETYLMFPTVSGVRFRELAAQVHDDFEQIAEDAKKKRNPKLVLESLSSTMKRCVSCHDSYRLKEMAH